MLCKRLDLSSFRRNVRQKEYVAFDEVFIEELKNIWNTH